MLTAAQLSKAACPADKQYIRLHDERGLFLEVSKTRARWEDLSLTIKPIAACLREYTFG